MITVLSQPNCVSCKFVKRRLDKLGVEYLEIDKSERPDLLERALSAGFKSAPAVFGHDDEPLFAGANVSEIENLAKLEALRVAS